MSTIDKKRLKLKRFKPSSDEQKEEILKRRKAENTNKSTKLWLDCLNDFLKQKYEGTPRSSSDGITAEQLPNILEDFYVEVKSQKIILDQKGDPLLDINGEEQYHDYCNNSLRSLRAGLNRHFKLKLNVNIIDSPMFIRANELFHGRLRINKQEGKGNTSHKPSISDADLEKLMTYFEKNMAGPPNATLLQEIVLFNIIFYMGRRGRENLRVMMKDTYDITTDSDGRRYIYQCKDESDKNHNENDVEMSNQARIYETGE